MDTNSQPQSSKALPHPSIEPPPSTAFANHLVGVTQPLPPVNYYSLPFDPNQLIFHHPSISPLSYMLPVPFEKPTALPVKATPYTDHENLQQTPAKESGNSETRAYRCSKCDKAYLSYPALYTHTKLKHMKPGDTPCITNGRMRGRPKKRMVVLLNVEKPYLLDS